MNKYPEAPWDAPADPFAAAAPFLAKPPSWLVLGGLGTDDDWRHARRRWPEVKIVGIDPDPRACDWQDEHGWPEDCELIRAALSLTDGTADIALGDVCHASMHPRQKEGQVLSRVPTITLESVFLQVMSADKESCPDNAVLWLDLEDWEWPALLGAGDCLNSFSVPLVNWEARFENEEWNGHCRKLLWGNGYRHAFTWFQQWWGHNEIWVPR